MTWAPAKPFSKGPHTEVFDVTTDSNGIANITFAQPFTSPSISIAVQRVADDSRQVSAEFFNLSATGMSIKTTREGTNQSILGLIVLSPTDRVSARVIVTIRESA